MKWYLIIRCAPIKCTHRVDFLGSSNVKNMPQGNKITCFFTRATLTEEPRYKEGTGDQEGTIIGKLGK